MPEVDLTKSKAEEPGVSQQSTPTMPDDETLLEALKACDNLGPYKRGLSVHYQHLRLEEKFGLEFR